MFITFNAVKITVDRTYFKIDDGDEPTDNYLSTKEIEQRYEVKVVFVNYDNEGRIFYNSFSEYGDFTINEKNYLKFIPEGNLERYDSLGIIQKISDSQNFVITYYNLKPNNSNF